ncbi:MAG: cycloisomerase [Bauldia sp.]|nr:cycloisomerase [Bauldia sp.]
MNKTLFCTVAAGAVLAASSALADGAFANGYTSVTVRSYDAEYANQGVGVDAEFFYAVDNEEIGKYSKATGELVDSWIDPEGGPAIHFDSAVVVDGLLYASHSNYRQWPMTSSIEVFDTATMEHVDTHSLGIQRGSLTWLDYHDGSFYGTFANYDNSGLAVIGDVEVTPYGDKLNTQVVRFNADWQVVEGWVIPPEILERFEVMSNSGGSWGPDGNLWLSGHDPREAYVMQLPEMGSELVWIATVPIEIEGQGIAWDRSADVPTLLGIVRPDRRVTVTEITFPATSPTQPVSAR